MSQRLRIISPKHGNPKGFIISKRSIGTIWINGKKYSYNLNQMESYRIPKRDKKKKVIYIRRK